MGYGSMTRLTASYAPHALARRIKPSMRLTQVQISTMQPMSDAYKSLASLWPWLAPVEDYAAEAAVLRQVIDTLGLPSRQETGRPRLLELGGGGGAMLANFADVYECHALDISREMLNVAESRVPGLVSHSGDMRKAKLKERFDVVLACDGIDYLLTEADVRATLANVAAMLAPGGLFLLGPTYVQETFEEGEAADELVAGEGKAISLQTSVRRKSQRVFELLHDMKIHDGDNMEELQEIHRCGLFPRSDWHDWLSDTEIELIDYFGLELSGATELPFELMVARRI